MKLYACDKDGFNAEPVNGFDKVKDTRDVFAMIPFLYDPSIKVVSISFINPDGTAQIKVEIDDPECDHLLTDYYYIQ